MRIDKIVLDNVVPEVFAGDEDEARRQSQVWRTKLEFERGKFYCVNASSGAGKTSLCSFLFGARTDYRGTISFDGIDIRPFSADRWGEIRRRHLAYLPQELEIFDELTALDNVLLKNRLTDFRTEEEIRRMFGFLEIDNRMTTLAARMSVGQKQRVALIRALCQPFDFLVLDEPVSHLDPFSNELAGRLAVEAAQAQNAGIIFTSVGNQLKLPAHHIPVML